jgi:Cu-processing system ATP-binding protein
MIRFTNLSKSYGALRVLQDVNLQVSSGRITAIIGPNGSGKTTLIKTLLGHVKPDQGIIRVDSETLNGHWEYRRRIGYMPQLAQFPGHLSVSEIIEMVKDIRNEQTQLDDELFYLFNLDGELNKPVRTLSGGTRQKLNAVLAFLFLPDIFVLDEPTAGLDPVASGKLKAKIKRVRADGKLVLLTSHMISELEELCDWIVFLLEGQIRFQGPIEQLLAHVKESRLEKAIAMLMEDVAA